jgi:2-oxoglutarate dehydrogenase E1 component
MSGESMERFSFANGANAAFLDQLYAQYRQDPASVDQSWQAFFQGYEFAGNAQALAAAGTATGHDDAKVEAFINAYRRLGHLSAHLNPLEGPPALAQAMTPEAQGLGTVASDAVFHPANLPSKGPITFGEIFSLLRETYCGKIGPDFREINDIEIVTWLQNEMESCRNQPKLERDAKRRIAERLNAAEGFERFLQARYLGQKRFSLEGNEALIPLLDTMLDTSANRGVEEICLGMSHRGRLNVLTNFMGKSPELILKEFEGSDFKTFDIDGDVKYHMGFASEVKSHSGRPMRLYLSPNPSHLEAVNPVIEGFTRARQMTVGDRNRTQVLPVLIHGDAAFIGQGLVAETLNLSQLDAYLTGGTIHIIVNNQIGFTTPPNESRSCTYSSDIAKIVRAPVFHVNSDDPEAVVWTAQLAVAYRQKFKRDVVIDLIGYRRHGHNETDEPAYTQPLMYKTIEQHPTVFKKYCEQLEKSGIFEAGEVKTMEKSYRDVWQRSFEALRSKNVVVAPASVPSAFQPIMAYQKIDENELFKSTTTAIANERLRDLGRKISTVPSGFATHPKLQKLLDARRGMTDGEGAIDWPMAKLLAFASLAAEGHHVRLSGQDCRRGTFSSRHAVWYDYGTGEPYFPLTTAVGGSPVDVINSPLSEQGVMGFEFGFSVAQPGSLVLWEGQFGDFVNGAQIIIDQFLVASEAKWRQTCGLVLLLPHGYEGAGPEHSSARPERFLQLCGNLNIQVAIPSSAAQYFHILRRQIHREFRKPLVLMTPKSLLRHPAVASKNSEFTEGGFREVIPDPVIGQSPADRSRIEQIVICTGKIYYELIEARDKGDGAIRGIPVARIEQLYPFPQAHVAALIGQFPKLKRIVWTQEEPFNMGAWTFINPRLQQLVPPGAELVYNGRVGSGTTAEGSAKAHAKEQARIIANAFVTGSEQWAKGFVTAVAR